MKKTWEKVLKACIKLAHKNNFIVNVFDLLYETSLEYSELKAILDGFVLGNELAVIDLKTYKFTGDINRKFDENEKPVPLKDSEESGQFGDIDEKMSDLERRRQELLKRMRESRSELFSDDEKEDEEDYGYYEDEDCHLNKLIESLHLDEDEDNDEE